VPAEFVISLPQGSISIAYSSIPLIASLEEPLRTQVRVAFADGIRIIWFVMIGISAAVIHLADGGYTYASKDGSEVAGDGGADTEKDADRDTTEPDIKTT
jgi:hypothetical protein